MTSDRSIIISKIRIMQAAHCALFVALGFAPEDPQFAVAREHLKRAIALSDEYYKTRNSIFWNTSPVRVKRRVRQKCNQLAFDIYSHMIELALLVNKYAAAQTSAGIPEPKQWREFLLNLECAFEWLEREHPQEINIKQLTLI